MAFVRVLATLLRDKQLGRRIVPIIPDESRTFGMEGMFRQVGIYSPFGQLYQPEDAEQLMFYKEDEHGQILEEGITEAGSMSSFIAAGTSYSAHAEQMVPFYIYYSMFGYQRVGDLVWAAGDSRARGFLLGGTAGRTTLNGEGLQHEDGHSHVLFSVVPNCRAYDPTFAYEVAVIIQDGLRRMVVEQEDVFYYLTLMNENYQHPAMPEGAEEGILRGMYLLRRGRRAEGRPRASSCSGRGRSCARCSPPPTCSSPTSGWPADVWSVTSFTELRRDGIEVERWNMLHPLEEPRSAYVAERLADTRAGGRLDRLHPRLRRPDPPVGAAALPGARHRRLRPQRLPPGAAQVLRGRPPLRRGRGAQGARRRGRDRRRRGCRGDRAYEIDSEAPMPTTV